MLCEIRDRATLTETGFNLNYLTLLAEGKGCKLDQSLGVSYPPFPKGLRVGATLWMLANIDQCFDDEAVKTLSAGRAAEMTSGYYHFLKGRFPKTIKKRANLKSATKPLGELYEAMFSLCTNVAGLIPVEERELGVDGAYWFHKCVIEIAAFGGFTPMIDMLYPPNTPERAAQREAAKGNKKLEGAYLKTVLTRIKDLEQPDDAKPLGYFGTLIYYGCMGAAHDRKVQNRYFNKFLRAARAYITATQGPKYLKAEVSSLGELRLKSVTKGVISKVDR